MTSYKTYYALNVQNDFKENNTKHYEDNNVISFQQCTVNNKKQFNERKFQRKILAQQIQSFIDENYDVLYNGLNSFISYEYGETSFKIGFTGIFIVVSLPLYLHENVYGMPIEGLKYEVILFNGVAHYTRDTLLEGLWKIKNGTYPIITSL